jgi:hypothetical protein
VTAGALISYLDTPVGPYREVLCSPAVVLDGVVPAAHVPFIAVDSAASLQGGRDNWALPKVPGVFSWSPHAAAARDPDGGWSVEARVRPRALRLPVALAARCVQESERGERVAFPVRGRGLAAPARVCVAAGGPAWPEWLVVGVHVGVLVTAARVHVGRPRP